MSLESERKIAVIGIVIGKNSFHLIGPDDLAPLFCGRNGRVIGPIISSAIVRSARYPNAAIAIYASASSRRGGLFWSVRKAGNAMG